MSKHGPFDGILGFSQVRFTQLSYWLFFFSLGVNEKKEISYDQLQFK